MLSLLLATLLGLCASTDVMSDARAHLKAKRFDEAAEVLGQHLKNNAGRVESLELYAQALKGLERKDESAYQLESALMLARDAGDEKKLKDLNRRLSKTDSLARKRQTLLASVVKSFAATAEKLFKDGHPERALGLVERVLPVAAGKERVKLEKLYEEVRAVFQEVELDSSGDEAGTDPGDRPMIVLESEFYTFHANIEREIVELVGITMDDIFRYFVELYFDGNYKRVSDRKVTIRIHPDHATMISNYPGGGGEGVGGWWSPGEWRIEVYDTRDRGPSLNGMLTTLYHEASHHFMTMFSSGSGVPSWLNEGTSCFFEGAIAMADHRVLWPDAARPRLQSLTSQLLAGTGPPLSQVIGFTDGGSYPGGYYPYGWGLVYFLQQYEDPETLEYVWRPYYARYRDEILGKREKSRELFEEILIEKGNPGNYDSFDGWIGAWETWITEEIFPLHFGRERGTRRRAKLERYLAAADGLDPRVEVEQEELLLRALKQIDFLRREEGDDPETPDAQLALLEITVLERLGRKGSAASRIERILAWADEGRVVIAPEQVEDLEKRMRRLDSKNAALRTLRIREKGFRKRAAGLLKQYSEVDRDLPLRAYTFARRIGNLLDDQDGLLAAAGELRERAVALGRIPSRVLRVEGKDWITVFPSEPKLRFKPTGNSLEIKMPGRPAGRICTNVPVDGSGYEIKAMLVARGETYRSSYYGIVVQGAPGKDWYAVSIDGKGALNLRHVSLDASGSPTTKLIESSARGIVPDPGEPWPLSVRVHLNGTLDIKLGELEWQSRLPVAPVGVQYVGVLIKDAELSVQDLLVEIFP